jgi:hypothetical protein
MDGWLEARWICEQYDLLGHIILLGIDLESYQLPQPVTLVKPIVGATIILRLGGFQLRNAVSC